MGGNVRRRIRVAASRISVFPGFQVGSSTGYDWEMSGMARTGQFLWLLITLVCLLAHLYSKKPFGNALDFATLLALVILFAKALLAVWTWGDLFCRKACLWLLNSSVCWTLQVKISIPEAVELSDLETMREDVAAAIPEGRVSSVSPDGTFQVECENGRRLSARPVIDGADKSWMVLDFAQLQIGFRDGVGVLRDQLLPMSESIAKAMGANPERQICVRAKFSGTSPHAAVLLNELRLRRDDKVLLTLTQDQTSVTITRDSISAASESPLEAVSSMATVFGFSLHGAPFASNV